MHRKSSAVDQLSARFAAWLDGIKWTDVEAGVNRFIDALKWVVRSLDTIKTIAEDIAILFAIKWAVGMVAAIGKVVTAIGTAGGGGTGGTRLTWLTRDGRKRRGTLAFNAWQKAQNPATYAPENIRRIRLSGKAYPRKNNANIQIRPPVEGGAGRAGSVIPTVAAWLDGPPSRSRRWSAGRRTGNACRARAGKSQPADRYRTARRRDLDPPRR